MTRKGTKKEKDKERELIKSRRQLKAAEYCIRTPEETIWWNQTLAQIDHDLACIRQEKTKQSTEVMKVGVVCPTGNNQHEPNEVTRSAMQDVRDRKNLMSLKEGQSVFDDLHGDGDK